MKSVVAPEYDSVFGIKLHEVGAGLTKCVVAPEQASPNCRLSRCQRFRSRRQGQACNIAIRITLQFKAELHILHA